MTRVYRFPDQLGGGEYEADGGGASDGTVGFYIPGLGDEILWLPKAWLIEVPPPLPSEPELHAVVLDGSARAWQHVHGGWLRVGHINPVEWSVVCEHGEPTLLVLDPFAEKVELPWRSDRPGEHGFAVTADQGEVVISLTKYATEGSMGTSTLALRRTPSIGRNLARVIWAAADVAEGGGS